MPPSWARFARQPQRQRQPHPASSSPLFLHDGRLGGRPGTAAGFKVACQPTRAQTPALRRLDSITQLPQQQQLAGPRGFLMAASVRTSLGTLLCPLCGPHTGRTGLRRRVAPVDSGRCWPLSSPPFISPLLSLTHQRGSALPAGRISFATTASPYFCFQPACQTQASRGLPAHPCKPASAAPIRPPPRCGRQPASGFETRPPPTPYHVPDCPCCMSFALTTAVFSHSGPRSACLFSPPSPGPAFTTHILCSALAWPSVAAIPAHLRRLPSVRPPCNVPADRKSVV